MIKNKMEKNTSCQLIECQADGDIGEEWLSPASPPDCLNNAENRVNYVLMKNSISRAKSKKTIGLSRSNIKLATVESTKSAKKFAKIERSFSRQEQLNFSCTVDQSPTKRILKQINNGLGKSGSKACFGKYLEYLSCRPEKRATSTKRDQKELSIESLKEKSNFNYNKVNWHNRNDCKLPTNLHKNKQKDLNRKKSNKRKNNKLGMMNFQKQVEVNLVNEASEISSEGSIVRNIYKNIIGGHGEKGQKLKENKGPSPKRANFQILSKQQGKEIS